jgi:glutathione S-transferase
MTATLKLVSFDLCPYVQRAAITLAEKGVPFDRIDVDLSAKPDWFRAISPLGKVPLLLVGDEVLFESAAIVEYLDEAYAPAKARHRAWIEFGSSVLADIWVIETTKDDYAFDGKLKSLTDKFGRLDKAIQGTPWFDGDRFSLVDAVFAPVFRYFDVFDQIRDLNLFNDLDRISNWRTALARRPSVINAVVPDYSARLRAFLKRHGGIMSRGW